MITDTDILALLCILLACACAGFVYYAWTEHMQAIAQRIRAEEQAMWADRFQADLDTCTAENARLRRLLTQRQRQPSPAAWPPTAPTPTTRPASSSPPTASTAPTATANLKLLRFSCFS